MTFETISFCCAAPSTVILHRCMHEHRHNYTPAPISKVDFLMIAQMSVNPRVGTSAVREQQVTKLTWKGGSQWQQQRLTSLPYFT